MHHSRVKPLVRMLIALVLTALIHVPNAVAEPVPDTAPRVLDSWSLPDADGKTVTFEPGSGSEYRVLFFWATWCPYCKALIPHLEKFRQAHEDEDIAFLAMNVWEENDPRAYMEKIGFNFRLVPAADEIAKNYGLKGTPGLILVNDQNEVLYERRSGTSPDKVVTDLEFTLKN